MDDALNRPGTTTRLLPLALLSGACALVYQIAWTRELRLVFGASTLASAAVVAIFVGGLGLGARVLGDRVDASATPLQTYARLELGIAISSAATPLLLDLARRIYVALGGSVSLGNQGATALRLALTALVLAAPTVLMGGTLPALAKSAMAGGAGGDPARRSVGVLYGVNTLGAVAGCMVPTFVLLERLGTRWTLWAAALLNASVALAAQAMAPRPPATSPAILEDTRPLESTAPAWLVSAAAAAAGFAFFLMELVFTRMLTPLLGGTVYTFGLVLAVALLGIGAGGALYAAVWRRLEPDLFSLASTSFCEALFLMVPYALGDRIAILALWARPVETASMRALLPGWLLVTAIVVFPSAVVAGLQFPLLVSLLGRGSARVARHVGRAYAWNTLGAMAGAIAGGFGLMPALSAVGCWKLAGGVLLATGLVAIFAHRWPVQTRANRVTFVVFAAAMVAFVGLVRGPTPVWRDSAIGVGRAARGNVGSAASVVAFVHEERERIVWDVDGIESTVALHGGSSYSFLTNGKSDGNCVADAGTQVMGGVLAALLHPGPRSAMVIGLGSGSSAGWLGRVPTMERVDAVELEPAMLEVARRCEAVNGHVLDNPRVHLVLGDAREVLSVTPARYDLVFSEPSNPYRAGVASLYTREYYERVRAHLEPGGVFAQWVQAYEIDPDTLRTILATLASTFPYVEVWQLEEPDLALVASEQPIAKDAATLRARVAGEPFRGALQAAWKVDDLEGVLAHFVATPALSAGIAAEGAVPLNTDDLTVAEFGFARSVNAGSLGGSSEVRKWAVDRGVTRPAITGAVDWQRVGLERAEIPCAYNGAPPYADPDDASADVRARLEFDRAGAEHHAEAAIAAWDRRATRDDSPTPIEALFLAEASLAARDVRTEERIQALWPRSRLDALALQVRWLDDAKLYGPEEVDLIEQALLVYRDEPWADDMWRVVGAAGSVSLRDRDVAQRMALALSRPFAAGASESARISELFLAVRHGLELDGCMEVLAREEGPLGRDEGMMDFRAACYEHTGDPRAAWAKAVAERESERTKHAVERWPWEL